MSKVFVLDTVKQPLEPVHPGRARLLLKSGKAAVYRKYPFVIILKRQVEAPAPSPLRLKIDPGAKTTGLALLDDARCEVVWAAELTHRGSAIREALSTRRAVRRGRRQRQTRYRKPRFQNRCRPKGWLPPSLRSRVQNILSWVNKLCRLCSLTALSQELVRFDLQKLENPEIRGLAYQQGTLQGYEVKEYLLEKWNRACAYCGKEEGALQVEHIRPKAKGGTERITNLTLACELCNRKKGTQDIGAFLAHSPERLTAILAQAKAPFKDATAVNATRWALFEQLKQTGLPVETGSGGRTKYNRVSRGLPKTHWLDAVCTGASTPETVSARGVVPLLIEARGRGHRRMALLTRHGFPRGYRSRHKRHHGFQTGEMVRAVVPEGYKQAGTHRGQVLARATGHFAIQTKAGKIDPVPARFCTPLLHSSGYDYRFGAALPPLLHPNKERLLPPRPEGSGYPQAEES